ncbi:MAG: NADH-quinone oxidoreductase subunit C [Bacteroidota bacterium]|nr:NADH-quinone oxidoreductase subunit C [Bacteroidota bacterium]
MVATEILNKLKSQFSDAIIDFKLEGVLDPFVKVKTESIREVSYYLRDDSDLQYDTLMCLSGVDLGKGILSVVYHLASIKHKHKITLKVEVSVEDPKVPSIESVWKTANWHEREAYDMFGIIFTDHPDLRRILLPDDWDGYPLRKDYQVQEYYQGIKVPY